jgi:uncharacterized membrane protein YhaH (DUF805 family)
MDTKTPLHVGRNIPDKGMLNLIKQKLEVNTPVKGIHDMLVRAGLEEKEIAYAIEYAQKEDRTAHQRAVEENDFLPPLKKIEDKIENKVSDIDGRITQVVTAALNHRGLFSGRLRRKDFIVGMLFFFGLGFIFFTIMLTWIQQLFPEFWADIQFVISQDTFGAILIFIPFIFAPITVMMLSLITRRLHNLALPGWIAACYLLTFISPFGDFGGSILFGMHVVLLTLFIIMLTKKGHPAPNRHGVHPPSIGSIFERVFGYEQKHM